MPRLQYFIAWVMFPNKAEALAAGDAATVAQCEARERRDAEFERHKLQRPDQLPGIEAQAFTVEWDTNESTRGQGTTHTILRCNGIELFREYAYYDGYKRYREIATILKAKCGDRLKDIAPTHSGWTWLGGDYAPGLREAEQVRKELFGAVPALEAARAKAGWPPLPPVKPMPLKPPAKPKLVALHAWVTVAVAVFPFGAKYLHWNTSASLAVFGSLVVALIALFLSPARQSYRSRPTRKK